MSFWVYILQCADGSYYTGHTDDLDRRLAEHDNGFCGGYTSTRRPLKLQWASDFADRDNAFAMERRIKGWSRAKKEALIVGDIERLKSLARSAAPPSSGSG